jgi:nucleoside-diphosphate-sugar epimerase
MSTPEPTGAIRLLVTGATGFIGSRLALHAHRLGHDVLATGRAEQALEMERLGELRSAGVRVETGLLQDAEWTARLVENRSVVIHLAAAQHESAMSEAYFRSINVDAVRILLDACVRAGVRRFVYGGTMGVFGESAGEEPLDERSPTAPDNVYTRTKLEAEALVRALSDRMETCIVRIAETYGPGDYRLLKLFRAIDSGRFFMIGDGRNRRQCIHVNDLVRGLMLAATHPSAAGETFIFAGREVLTTNELVRDVAAALERRPPRARLPLWPFAIAARILETVLPPLHIEPPLHSRRLDFFRKSFVLSTVKAQTLLGFTPEIDFLTGASDTVRWYRAQGLLAATTSGKAAPAESI